MSFDDLEPRPARDAIVAALAREDLDLLSVEELEARIAALHAEIARDQAAIDAKTTKKRAADALFSFGR